MAGSTSIVPGGIPNGKRARVQASTLLLKEWIGLRYPSALVYYQLRLGPTPRTVLNVPLTPAVERMLRGANRYADAVILTSSGGLIVEAKVEPTAEAVGQVLYYLRLYWQAPELSQYSGIPFQPVVLFAEGDETVTSFAHSLGCRVEIYSPPWIAAYLEGLLAQGRGVQSGTVATPVTT